MITERTIKIPIYDITLKIRVADSWKELKEKYPYDYEDKECKGCTTEFLNGSIGLFVPPNNGDTLVHELHHVKSLVWKIIGHHPSTEEDEPDAYLIGWLYNKVNKVINIHLADNAK